MGSALYSQVPAEKFPNSAGVKHSVSGLSLVKKPKIQMSTFTFLVETDFDFHQYYYNSRPILGPLLSSIGLIRQLVSSLELTWIFSQSDVPRAAICKEEKKVSEMLEIIRQR